MSSSATDTVNTSDVKPNVKDFDEEAQRGRRKQNKRGTRIRVVCEPTVSVEFSALKKPDLRIFGRAPKWGESEKKKVFFLRRFFALALFSARP